MQTLNIEYGYQEGEDEMEDDVREKKNQEQEEIENEEINMIKRGKPTGCDEITSKMIKNLDDRGL